MSKNPPSIPESSIRNEEYQEPKKPVFLYVVIAVLVVAVAALGAVSFLSLSHLVTLQQKVQSLSDTVQYISTNASTLISQADQLEELREQEASVQTATDEISSVDSQTDSSASADASSNPSTSAQQEGTLSPSSGTTFTDNSDDSLDNLLNQVQTLLPQDNGTWSVYVCNLSLDSDGVINDTPMQAASLIKLYIMGAVYENYDSLAQSHSTDELDSNISSMITVSDNDAANTLVNWLGNGDDGAGMAKVNEFCQNHDFTSTQMNRMLLSGNENGDNYTSVRDCGTFLKEIYQISNGTISDSTLPNSEAMYYQLKMQQRKNKIPAQLPEGVHTANKTGELDTVENDAAIIFDTAKGINLIVCFMSQDLTDTEAARQTIAADARAIYGYYNE